MKILHTGVWWSYGLELIENGITYTKAQKLYCKGIQCVNNTWDSQHCTFCSWEEAQIKFKLTAVENKDWIKLMSKIVDIWRRLIEDDPETTHSGKWAGFYFDNADDPTFVLSG